MSYMPVPWQIPLTIRNLLVVAQLAVASIEGHRISMEALVATEEMFELAKHMPNLLKLFRHHKNLNSASIALETYEGQAFFEDTAQNEQVTTVACLFFRANTKVAPRAFVCIATPTKTYVERNKTCIGGPTGIYTGAISCY
ncbi:hypothetical protein VTL71DRAFT_10607 [Oculimacula yallundae]|uniref:Uncharacterized protein n=1 Tax=Oculimacula yallundae TaxID=86028 RepID=A0ABR4CV86_9HELO